MDGSSIRTASGEQQDVGEKREDSSSTWKYTGNKGRAARDVLVPGRHKFWLMTRANLHESRIVVAPKITTKRTEENVVDVTGNDGKENAFILPTQDDNIRHDVYSLQPSRFKRQTKVLLPNAFCEFQPIALSNHY